MQDEGRYLPDEYETADRTPCNCPFCGYDGRFDGQGRYPRTMKVKRDGSMNEYDTEWTQIRCPNCNGRFRMLDYVEAKDD